MTTQPAPAATISSSELHFISSCERRIACSSWRESWFACMLMLLPTIGLACDMADRKACEQKIVTLVSYRSEAIERTFGDLSAVLPGQVRIKFVTARDPVHPLPAGAMAYDPEERTLFMSHSVLSARLPTPSRSAAHYWPFYEQKEVREAFPVVEAIDDALWNVYLQRAAAARGGVWDAEDCRSVHAEKRLPCEMVTSAITQAIKTRRLPIFNENRIDRIWPEDFASFARRNWQHEEAEYRDARRYGGLLLIRPLIREFGVPRALAYLAQTPLQIEENNLRISAQRYQDRARDALRIRSVDWVARARGDSPSSFTVNKPE